MQNAQAAEFESEILEIRKKQGLMIQLNCVYTLSSNKCADRYCFFRSEQADEMKIMCFFRVDFVCVVFSFLKF
jgi:hypothetical protein